MHGKTSPVFHTNIGLLEGLPKWVELGHGGCRWQGRQGGAACCKLHAVSSTRTFTVLIRLPSMHTTHSAPHPFAAQPL